jgi:ATP-dependent exoDNAse (exonuclease V) alpha subunit
MEFNLNTKQKAVFKQLIDFIDSESHDTFILNGFAGTGKTFLIQHFAKHLEKEKHKFLLIASTGRAAAVLKGKTGLPTNTIHGQLYGFSNIEGEDENIPADAPNEAYGQMKLIFSPKQQIEKGCLYIVDEASMLGSESGPETSFANFGSGLLLPDLLKAINKNKIVFVGDPCQLPPINQSISPALNKNWLSQHNRKVTVATLDEIMRTAKNNDILTLAADVRSGIGKAKSENWTKLKALYRNNCTIHENNNELFEAYFNRFSRNDIKNCIAIARKNEICQNINVAFRKKLFPITNNLINEGELLMVSQNNYLVPLSNGDFVKVLKVGKSNMYAGLHFTSIKVLHVETEQEFDIKIVQEPFVNGSANLNTHQQRALMIEFSRKMKKQNIKPKSEIYLERMKKDEYLNCLRATYGYAVTCHKAQGGEWDHVYLFLDKSMYGAMKNDELLRWWYTAITRTKKQLHLHYEWWLK